MQPTVNVDEIIKSLTKKLPGFRYTITSSSMGPMVTWGHLDRRMMKEELTAKPIKRYQGKSIEDCFQHIDKHYQEMEKHASAREKNDAERRKRIREHFNDPQVVQNMSLVNEAQNIEDTERRSSLIESDETEPVSWRTNNTRTSRTRT